MSRRVTKYMGYCAGEWPIGYSDLPEYNSPLGLTKHTYGQKAAKMRSLHPAPLDAASVCWRPEQDMHKTLPLDIFEMV